MVSVTTRVPAEDALDQQAILAWVDGLAGRRDAGEQRRLADACKLAIEVHREGRERTGKSTLRHALAVAEILDDMGLDWETLAAAILHDVVAHETVSLDQIETRFGSAVARMVKDMARIGSLAGVRTGEDRAGMAGHTENLRRMLLSIADDIRVLLIVLAERLHEMRLLKHLSSEFQVREARETQEIYAPLANRLGIWQIKWELEDLCLRYLEPGAYKEIASALDGRRADRERFINDVMALLRGKFDAIGLQARISGRPKHIFSIWKKMRRKAVQIDQIFDLRAVRVLVDNVADCYAALGVVHGLWRHIPGEFDDYIATPKANMYRSIHTAVVGPEEKPLEVQIRTHDMHDHAELGVAAHWRYKESGGREDPAFQRRIAQMRNWLEMKEEPVEREEGGENFRGELEARQIYVLTPQGKVVELPKGATAVDFAYAIHSSVGDRCRGARVNGRIAPLTQPLESGQSVEIITVKEGGPSRDWLSPHHGYIKTSRARARVRHWFKQQDFAEHLQQGRASLEKEITRLGVHKPDLERAARRFNMKRVDDLLAAIGRGELSPIQIAGMGERSVPGGGAEQPPTPPRRRAHHRKRAGGRGEVVVEGVDDLMTHMARCCKPVPNDRIVGFITRGRGVTVHRRDCKMIKALREPDQGRLVDVVWADAVASGGGYPVDVRVFASDRKGLLRDISAILANEEVDVQGVHTQTDRKADRAAMRFTIEVSSMRQLSRVLEKIAQLPEVLDVRRQV